MLELLPPSEQLEGSDQNRPYSDGDSEQRLFELFQNHDQQAVDAAINAILQSNPSWPERVHLSPQRLHLLDWYPFDAQASLLELGAGCGAMTRLFCERVATVTALELSTRRAEILRHRHWAQTNLNVIVGDLARFAARKEQFDYVICIGVLEYAGRYVDVTDAHSNASYIQFLRDAAICLKPGGTLLIAIENQLGIKYLAGSPEDHYGLPLVGIEDYLDDTGIRTFGKRELKSLIEAAGLTVEQFYYPVPDYKLPIAIYSDALPPGSIGHIGSLYPSVDYAYPTELYFDEGQFMRIAERNQLVTEFANSFLVECRR